MTARRNYIAARYISTTEDDQKSVTDGANDLSTDDGKGCIPKGYGICILVAERDVIRMHAN